jgi:hypothetical protein
MARIDSAPAKCYVGFEHSVSRSRASSAGWGGVGVGVGTTKRMTMTISLVIVCTRPKLGGPHAPKRARPPVAQRRFDSPTEWQTATPATALRIGEASPALSSGLVW